MPTYQPMHHPLHALACTLPVYYYQRGALPSLTNQCIISALCIPRPHRSDSVIHSPVYDRHSICPPLRLVSQFRKTWQTSPRQR